VSRSATTHEPPTASTPPAIPNACNRAAPGSPTRPPCSWTTARLEVGWLSRLPDGPA
jgi:hypothetical protein